MTLQGPLQGPGTLQRQDPWRYRGQGCCGGRIVTLQRTHPESLQGPLQGPGTLRRQDRDVAGAVTGARDGAGAGSGAREGPGGRRRLEREVEGAASRTGEVTR